MPISRIQSTDLIYKNFRTLKTPKRGISFPEMSVLRRSKGVKDFGGPTPNEVPDDINVEQMVKKGAVGAAEGAIVGAIIGSAIPVVGTALGAWFGGAIAGAFGMTAGAATKKK